MLLTLSVEVWQLARCPWSTSKERVIELRADGSRLRTTATASIECFHLHVPVGFSKPLARPRSCLYTSRLSGQFYVFLPIFYRFR
jgi:hypothetical protein